MQLTARAAGSTSSARVVVSRAVASSDSFVPLRWLKSGHLQTLGAAAPLFTRVPEVPPAQRCAVPIAGGSLHGALWMHARRAPGVVVAHGIGGTGASPSIVRGASALFRAGYHVLCFDMRGAGESLEDVPSLYHAGLTADLDAALTWLASRPRVDGVCLVGFSGGGSMALKLAGEWGEAAPPHVRCVASVSAPLDYTLVAPWMEGRGRLPYRLHVLGGLADGAKKFAERHPSRARYKAHEVKRLGSLRQYDDTVIVPMHGFASVEDYRAQASSGPWLPRVRVPSLLVHAEDDPMVPMRTLTPWLSAASPAVDVRLSRHGGHVGWLSGLDAQSWLGGWAVRQVLSHLRAHAPAREDAS